MRRIAAFLVRRPRLAAVYVLVMVLIGVYSAFRAPVSLYPSVVRPTVNVSCDYPGANAGEVVNTVAGPIEDQVNGVEGMDHMCSTCNDNGNYSLTVYFKVGYDRDVALMKVQSKVQQALTLLPQEVKNTGVTVTIGEVEQLGTLVLWSDKGELSREEIVDYAYGVVAPALALVPGVAKAAIKDAKLAMRVWLDPDRMAALGINTSEVVAAIKAQNVQASLGSVGAYPNDVADGRVISLISKGRLSTPQEFEKIIVRTDRDGGLVRLGDIGRIRMGYQAYGKEGLHNDKTAAYLSLFLLPGADLLGTERALKAKIEELQGTFPGDLMWDMSYSITRNLRSALLNTGWSLLQAFVLVLVLTALWLRSVRLTGIVFATSLAPVSASLAFVVATGNLVNLLTLYALFLVVPLAVVASVRTVRTGSCSATSFIAFAAILVCAMVPIAMIDGVQGMFYRQFALVLAPAGVFIALTSAWAAPTIAVAFGRRKREIARPLRTGGPSGGLAVSALVFLSIGLVAWSLAKALPQEFIPPEDRGVYTVDFRGPEGGRMGPAMDIVKRFIREMLKIDGTLNTTTFVGASDIAGDGEGNAIVRLNLKDWGDRDGSSSYDAIAAKVADLARRVPEFDVNVTKFPPVPGIGSAGGVGILIQSLNETDPVRFAAEMQRLRRAYAESPLAEAVTCGSIADTPRLRVKVDREKCELMQVPMSLLYSTLQHYLGSTYVNDINLGTQVNRVTVMSDGGRRNDKRDIGSLRVRSNSGQMVPVSVLTTLEEEIGARCCKRYNRYLYGTIQFDPRQGVATSEAIAEVRRISKESLGRGYVQGWADLTYEMFQARGDSQVLMVLSFLAVMLVLVVYYESFRLAIRHMLPSAAVFFGAVLAHGSSGIPMSLYSWFAILLAVVLSNAIWLLSRGENDAFGRVGGFLSMAMFALPLLLSVGAVASGSRSFGVALVGGFTAGALLCWLGGCGVRPRGQEVISRVG